MSKKRKQQKGGRLLLIGCAAFALLFLLCGGLAGGGAYWWYTKSNADKGPLAKDKGKAPEPVLKFPAKPRKVDLATLEPYLATRRRSSEPHPDRGRPIGKMLLVDGYSNSVDDFHAHVPSDLAADAPGEVDVIVELKRDTIRWLDYDNGQVGMRGRILIAVVDPLSGLRLHTIEVHGPEPPGVIFGKDKGPARPPPPTFPSSHEVITSLAKLPRKR